MEVVLSPEQVTVLEESITFNGYSPYQKSIGTHFVSIVVIGTQYTEYPVFEVYAWDFSQNLRQYVIPPDCKSTIYNPGVLHIVLMSRMKDNVKYRDLNIVIKYTGKVLITDDFIWERYVHMGFHSPLSYRKVIELTFDNGMLYQRA